MPCLATIEIEEHLHCNPTRVSALLLRQAAEELLGRFLKDDEMLGIFAFQKPEPHQELSLEQWEQEMSELIESFPQSPLLSDEAISRESIYTREDEML